MPYSGPPWAGIGEELWSQQSLGLGLPWASWLLERHGEEPWSQRSLGHSPVLLEGQPHVLLHLLQAMIIRVDEVKGQRLGERAVPPAWRHP